MIASSSSLTGLLPHDAARLFGHIANIHARGCKAMSYEKGPVCLASFLKAATEVSPAAGAVSRPSSPVLFADRSTATRNHIRFGYHRSQHVFWSSANGCLSQAVVTTNAMTNRCGRLRCSASNFNAASSMVQRASFRLWIPIAQ